MDLGQTLRMLAMHEPAQAGVGWGLLSWATNGHGTGLGRARDHVWKVGDVTAQAAEMEALDSPKPGLATLQQPGAHHTRATWGYGELAGRRSVL